MDFTRSSGGQPFDQIFTSAIGPAVFPHLLTPDTRFDDNGKYKVGIQLDADEARAVRDALTALYRRAFPDAKGEPHLPIKSDDGRLYLVAKSTYKPKLLTPDRREISEPILVRSGHKIRVTGRVRPFRNGGLVSGVACYLASVQVHEPLDRLETYRIAGEGEERPFLAVPETEAAPGVSAPSFEDDLPF